MALLAIAPPLLIMIMRLTTSRATMGDKVNRWWVSLLGWATTAAVTATTLALLATWVMPG